MEAAFSCAFHQSGELMLWAALAVVCLPQDMVSPTPHHADGDDPVAQSAPDPQAFRIDDVVVVGRRGSTPLTPEREFSAADIEVLGAYDIAEVIRRLRDNLGLDEFPDVMVNGRRALNAADFMGFPPDALVRVEVLPSEAGALYGNDPSRRVVNIVLQRQFRSRDGALAGSRPTAGGRSSLSADVRQSGIQDDSTRQFGLRMSRDTGLRAEEREDYSRDHPDAAGTTLRPATDILQINGSMTGALGDWSGSVNANASRTDSAFVSRVGNDRVETRQRGHDLTATAALGGEVWGWTTQLGVDANLSESRQTGIAEVRGRALRLGANARIDRPLMELPAGALRVNASGRLWSSRTETGTDADRLERSSRSLDLNSNLFIPLARRAAGGEGMTRGLPLPGDLSLTLGGAVRGLYGDSGRGEAFNVGLNWSPAQRIRFDAMWSATFDSPTAMQRFDPVLYGPPQTVFDFATGEAVEILPLRGGNPDLGPAEARHLTLGASFGPYTAWSLAGSVNYRQAKTTSNISALPAITPEIEAAFPDRFIRDGDGRLTSIDQRPLNLGSSLSETLSSTLNFGLPFSRPEGVAPPQLQVSISHTLQLANQLTLIPGLPVMDRLAGDGGGLSRHQLAVRVDGSAGNWGFNAGVNWSSAYQRRRDTGRDGPGDLALAAFATTDLRVRYQFRGDASSGPGNLRLELEISNLLDARPEASIGGVRAPGYGRDDQDPLGRAVRLFLSRRF